MLNAMVLPVLDGRHSAATVSRWIKSEGEYVGAGDVVLEVRIELIAAENEDDPAAFSAELVAAQNGYLVRRCVHEEGYTEKGKPLAIFNDRLVDPGSISCNELFGLPKVRVRNRTAWGPSGFQWDEW